VLKTDLLYFQIRNSRISTEDARAWKNSFNVVNENLSDPIYSDPIYDMLYETTNSTYKRIQLDGHAWLLLFRIMFGYIRPEL